MSHGLSSLPPLSQQDLLLLSAYIDGQLSDAERASLGERLQTDPVLQAHLEELRRVVELVGQAERLPVPRSFTLDPAVYGTQRRRWTGVFGPALAAGVAILLVAVCLGVLLLRPGRLGPAAAPLAPAMELAEEEAAPAAEEEEAIPEEEALEAPAEELPAEEEEAAVEAEALDEAQAVEEGEFGGGEAAAPEAEMFEEPAPAEEEAPPPEEEAAEEAEPPEPTSAPEGAPTPATTGSPAAGVERSAEATMLASGAPTEWAAASPALTASLLPTPTPEPREADKVSPTTPPPTPTFTLAPTPTPAVVAPRLALAAIGIVLLAGVAAAVGFILLRRSAR